jgi:polysaccharide deacetylase family protein (PEP-CTERM system associated)
VGCHSYQHELATRFTPSQFRNDTYKAKSLIESVIGKTVNVFRAPGFSITENNPWALDVLCELGFKYDCSVFPAHHDFGGMPNYGRGEPTILKYGESSIKEFPINIQTFLGKKIVFSGGGFFRLFPYPIIKSWGKQSDYMMCYLHPRDFDKGQPMVKSLPLKRKFKSYIGINGAFRKFQKLLSDFDFVNVEKADSLIDWSKVKTIQLK